MARIRTVKPEIRRSRTVCGWLGKGSGGKYAVRWTFVGLPGYVDDKGRGEDDPRLLKSELYPIDDDMTAAKLEKHMAEMEKDGVICRYITDGRRYFHLVNFDEHQRVNRPTGSRFPPCPSHEQDTRTA